jgi:hypothetical protein
MEFTFNIHTERADGAYVAYCLEMGLVATSDDPTMLPSIMSKLIHRQVEFALQNNNPADIYRPAPPEVWERFRAARKQRAEVEERIQRKVHIKDWPTFTLGQASYAAAG